MPEISQGGNCIGRYALLALGSSWITPRHIEAGRRALIRNVRSGGKVRVSIFPYKPVTRKPIGTRMGSGKGTLEHRVAVVKPGRMIYQLSGVSEIIARKAMSMAAFKMPMRTQCKFLG